MRTVQRLTVSKGFRELVARLYPGLDLNPAYWRLLQYLLFGTFKDKETGNLLLKQDILAQMEGKALNHYNGETFLKAFQRDVMSPAIFSWTGWVPGAKCRQLKPLQWQPEMESALEEEWDKLNHSEGRVYLVDGSRFSQAKQRAERKRQKTEALARLCDCPEAYEVQDYMNQLPPNLFTKLLLPELPKAVQAAKLIKKKRVRDQQFRILKAIAEQPQTIYAPSKELRTARLFGGGDSIPYLERSVRKALCSQLFEADIANSQLAIAARYWGVPEVEEFLRDGGKIWRHLCEIIGFPVEGLKEIKKAFKEPFYALIYGMGKAQVQGKFTKNLKEFGIEKGGALIMTSPLIQALLSARERMAAKIRQEGGGYTCFGKWLPFSSELDEYEILAQQAQAVELDILMPAIRLAKTTEDFKILVWQHDGFSVHFQRRRESWMRRITEAVKRDGIEKHGVITELEWE